MLRTPIGSLAAWGLPVLLNATLLPALQPPTPEQIRQYKTDGTWAARVEQARALGNDRVDPALAAHLRYRLERQATLAAGLPVGEEQALPWQGGLPAKGTVKTLVLLIDFPDYPRTASQTVADVQNKFFGTGDSGQYPYESLRNYYQRASYNQLTIQGNVLGWYRAPSNRSSYAQTGSAREQLIMAALNYFNSQGHDFTQYDNNANGVIDSLFVKWTGPDNGWANFWWAYQTGWYANPNFRIDGKALGAYVWSWYSNPTGGVFQPHVDIHETGHLLGLPDYYDYDDSVGPRGGVGGLDMMDGNWGDHNCFSKFLLEWLTPTTLVSGSQVLTLNPSGVSKDCILIMPNYTPGTFFDEFFMVQYRRRNTGNDPSNYPTDGLVVWHADSTLSGGGFQFNNSSSPHKLIRLMEADGLEEIETSAGRADAGDFFVGAKVFGPLTTPSSRDYTGATTGVLVDQLSAAGTAMTARFSLAGGRLVIPAGWSVTEESCKTGVVGNQAVDPLEAVTVEFSLQNIGLVTATNVRARLLATGGVTSPGTWQSYGTLTAGGAAVSRPFSFVAQGDCGATLTATLQLDNGVTMIGQTAFTIPLGKAAPGGGYACCFTSTSVGDFDGDGDSDQEDFGRLQACLSGSVPQPAPECLPGRMDNDQDVDQADIVIFRRCHTAQGVAPDPACRNP